MKKGLFIFLVTTSLCCNATARAETPLQPSSAPVVENKMAMDGRFTQCLNDASCSIQTHMQIIQKENDEMNRHFQKIHQACADMNFQDCLDPQTEEMQGWYASNGNMRQMMQHMMMQSMGAPALETQEPSAGEPEKSPVTDGKEKTIWDKIWWYGGGK